MKLRRLSIVPFALALALLTTGCSRDSSTIDKAAPTTSTGQSAESTEPQTVPIDTTPHTVPSSAPAAVDLADPVPAERPAELLPGVVLRISSVEEVDLEGRGSGDSSGPGIAVHVTMENRTTKRVDFSTLAVVAESSDGTPLLPSRSKPASVPSGELGPGATGTAVWTFHLDGDPAGNLVQVSHPSSPVVLQFRL